MRILRHATTLLLLHVAVGGLFGRIDLVRIVDAVVVALTGLGGVQAGLQGGKLATASVGGTLCDAVQHIPG